MERLDGYTLVGHLISQKSALVNESLLMLLLSLTWDDAATVRVQRPCISNTTAFRELVLPVENWLGAPGPVKRLFFRHLLSLFTNNARVKANVRVLRQMDFFSRWLACVMDPALVGDLRAEAMDVACAYFDAERSAADLQTLAEVLLATRSFAARAPSERHDAVGQDTGADVEGLVVRVEFVQCRLLQLLLDGFVNDDQSPSLAQRVVKELGAAWLLHFVEPPAGSGTVEVVLRMLALLLSDRGYGFAAAFKSTGVSGYSVLAEVLPAFADHDAIYPLLFAMFLGMPATCVSLSLWGVTRAAARRRMASSHGRRPLSAAGPTKGKILHDGAPCHVQVQDGR